MPSPSRRLAGAAGYTLVELLIATALTLVIGGAVLSFLIVALQQQNASASRTVASRQAEVGFQRLDNDLRQASAATLTWNASGSTVSAVLTVPVPGTNGASSQSVTWSCSGSSTTGTCTRQVGSGTAVTEVTGVNSLQFAPVSSTGATLSSPATNPAYVSVTLAVNDISQNDSTSSHVVTGVSNTITLHDGVSLRNFS